MVFQAKGKIGDNLPTLLIKMSPWTKKEAAELRNWFWGHTILVEDPIYPEKSFLTSEFYSGDFSNKIADKMPYRILPSTDNKPYFNFIRKELV